MLLPWHFSINVMHTYEQLIFIMLEGMVVLLACTMMQWWKSDASSQCKQSWGHCLGTGWESTMLRSREKGLSEMSLTCPQLSHWGYFPLLHVLGQRSPGPGVMLGGANTEQISGPLRLLEYEELAVREEGTWGGVCTGVLSSLWPNTRQAQDGTPWRWAKSSCSCCLCVGVARCWETLMIWKTIAGIPLRSKQDQSTECASLRVVVQLPSHVLLFVTPLTAAHQASLSFTVSQSLLKIMFIESVILSHCLILCRPLSPALHLS